jgi:hypothetical protein
MTRNVFIGVVAAICVVLMQLGYWFWTYQLWQSDRQLLAAVLILLDLLVIWFVIYWHFPSR